MSSSLGLLLFIASCVVIALAQSGGMVIAGRVIQGAAGSTLLACGLSLLTVATTGDARLRSVSLWGAAAAVGAAAGPLVGGILVESTGWQGLFWIDAAIAAGCVVLTFAAVQESLNPEAPRSIDYAGAALVALTLTPFVLAVSKGPDWGWGSLATVGCFVLSIAAGFGFVWTERRVAAPLLDLRLMRNTVLVASTIAILIASGTINALMYLVSLYFQDPHALDFSPLQAGLATLPATVALVVSAPLIPRLARRFGGRRVVGLGFAITTAGYVAVALVQPSWKYVAFLLPLVAIAFGMGLSNGPALLGIDRVGRREPGRRGVGRVQHGEVRRRCVGDGDRRDDLWQRDRYCHRRRSIRGGCTRVRTVSRVVGHGGDQPVRGRDGGAATASSGTDRNPGGHGRRCCCAQPYPPDLCHARALGDLMRPPLTARRQ